MPEGPHEARRTGREALTVQRIQPAYQQVAEQLKALIVRGTLHPGAKLPVEAELSSSFGVSRSTIREALRLLSSQNLVYTVRGAAGGNFVSRADPEATSDFLETAIAMLTGTEGVSAQDLFEIRDLLEGRATALAALHRSEGDLKELRSAISTDGSSTGRANRFERHYRFHATVIAASGNPLLPLMTLPIYRVIRARYVRERDDEAIFARAEADHERILEHVERQRAEEATEAMQDHLRWVRHYYEGGFPTA